MLHILSPPIKVFSETRSADLLLIFCMLACFSAFLCCRRAGFLLLLCFTTVFLMHFLEFTRSPNEKLRTWAGVIRIGKISAVFLTITFALMAVFLTN